jgi:hypothetical protein
VRSERLAGQSIRLTADDAADDADDADLTIDPMESTRR